MHDTPTVAARRKRLQEWIDARHEGVQAAFVAATGINQGELSALLKVDGKSFGEKKAASLEQAAKMPAGYLTTPLSPAGTHSAKPAGRPDHIGEDAPAYRVTPEILRDAMTLLDELDAVLGRMPSARPSPERLAIACEVVSQGEVIEGKSVVVRLAERLRKQ